MNFIISALSQISLQPILQGINYIISILIDLVTHDKKNTVFPRSIIRFDEFGLEQDTFNLIALSCIY